MDITKRTVGDVLEVTVVGRLDAYWADHLSAALNEAVHDGAHRIRLDMAGVSYMSSVGLRVLLKFHKDLERIKGSFVVCNESAAVKTVLELAGLETLLAHEIEPAAVATAARGVESEHAAFEVFDLAPGATLRCRVVGRPEPLVGCSFGAADCRTLRFPPSTFGVGLGAFGSGFADCQARFGEFLCAAGAAAYLPTDGTDAADYLVSSGALIPELSVLYGLVGEGSFAQLARFAAKPSSEPITLSAVAETCLGIARADCAGIVMVAESAGLMGAALRRSPVTSTAGAPFTHPQIREWISFTPERAYPRGLALVVGVVARHDQPALSALLRPLRGDGGPTGHFHAAAFSYRPLQKGAIELQPTVTALFEGETLLGVLHLLHDDRPIVGAGDSELVRGACWIGPIHNIVTD